MLLFHGALRRLPTIFRRSISSSIDPKHPCNLMKQDPIEICADLWLQSFSRRDFPVAFVNLTGFLKKFDLWVLAYQRASAHFTGSAYPPRNVIHVPTLRNLQSLQESVISGSFSWGSTSDLLIRAPNDVPSTKIISKRKLKLLARAAGPPFQDHVVSELLLLVLEPIFEPRFSSRSHAFRPGRSPHTVIRTIRSNFAGYLWFIRGDLSAVSERFDHDLVIRCLEKGTKDPKILRLIRSGLKFSADPKLLVDGLEEKRKKKRKKKKRVLKENEPKPDPYWLRVFFNFSPDEAAQVPSYGGCGILSPLLLNLCLNELDVWMEEKIVSYFKPSKLDSIWKNSLRDGSHNPAWPEFVPAAGGKEKTKRMDYIRHGSHFLVGIRGPREDAAELRKEIMEFCEATFGRRPENQSLQIEHVTRGIEFLDHVISRRVIYPNLRYTGSGGKIVSQKGVGTLLSVSASLERCIRHFRNLELVKGDKDPEPLPCSPMLYSGQAHTNAQMNKLLETLADWFRYADNRKKVVGFCAYVVRSSIAKLYAARYRLKSRAKVYGLSGRDLRRPLRESTTGRAAPEFSDLLRMGLVDAIEGVQFSRFSLIPTCDYAPFPRNWVPHHERVLDELLRLQNPKVLGELMGSGFGGRRLPLDEMSRIVWSVKVNGQQRRALTQGPGPAIESC
ncbi:intron maturase, type II family protein [Wolffia australiana]